MIKWDQIGKCRNRLPIPWGASMKGSVFFLAIAGLTVADATAQVRAADAPPLSFVPSSSFFLGVGGGYNVANFGTQNVYAVGTSNVYQNGLLISSGSAAGPANIETNSQSAVAFSAQGGYFQHFNSSDWLWGAKFAYSYLGATSIVRMHCCRKQDRSRRPEAILPFPSPETHSCSLSRPMSRSSWLLFPSSENPSIGA
jgi:hypothetical protein